MDETAVKQALAVAEANLQSLKAMLDEVKATRDDLRRALRATYLAPWGGCQPIAANPPKCAVVPPSRR